MKTKASHSLILLLAAAPFVFAQVPSGTAPAPAVSPAPASLPGTTEAPPPDSSSGDAGSPFLPVRPSVAGDVATEEPVAPAGLPGGAPDSAPVPGLEGSASISGGPPATAAGRPPAPLPPTPARVPGTPAPELPPPALVPPSPSGLSPAPVPVPPPPLGVPANPVAPRMAQPYPTPAAGAPPNVYFERKIEGNFETPPTIVAVESDPNAVAGNYTPAPRGEQVIHDIKLKVLQRHYESTLSEAVESEKAAIFASGGEREALTAKAKALQEFAAKLENDIRALPGNARTAGVQNRMHVFGQSASADGLTPSPGTSNGRGNKVSAQVPAPGLHVETVPADSNARFRVTRLPADAPDRNRSSR